MHRSDLVPFEDGLFVVITDYSALLCVLWGHLEGRSARINREQGTYINPIPGDLLGKGQETIHHLRTLQ